MIDREKEGKEEEREREIQVGYCEEIIDIRANKRKENSIGMKNREKQERNYISTKILPNAIKIDRYL